MQLFLSLVALSAYTVAELSQVPHLSLLKGSQETLCIVLVS